MRAWANGRGSSIKIVHLTFDLDLCRAKKQTNIQWSMAVLVKLLVAVAVVGRNS